jgi:hypothetical protein
MHPMHPFFAMFFVLFIFVLGAAAGSVMVNATKTGGKKKAKIARLEARIEALERKP